PLAHEALHQGQQGRRCKRVGGSQRSSEAPVLNGRDLAPRTADCTPSRAALPSAQAKEPARKGDETAAIHEIFSRRHGSSVDALTTEPKLALHAPALIDRPLCRKP